MRITVIGPYPPFRGGISDFNFSLIEELSKEHEVQIINFSTQYPKFIFPGQTQYKSNEEAKVKSNRILSSVNIFSWQRTAHKIQEFDAELVIFQYWMPFFTFAYNYIIKKIKKSNISNIISICHNLRPHEDKIFYKYLTKRFINIVDKFVVMSDSVQTELLNFKFDAEYKILFHPIYDIFGSEINKNVAKKQLGLVSENIILFFGLIREYKGLDILLKSIPIIRNNLNDFTLVIAGECYENPSKYHKIIKDMGIENYINMKMEFVPDKDVAQYFSAADVIVLPYRSATQSGITQIAYNFNRPVIISDVGGLSEIVKDGKTGVITRANPEDFAIAIYNFFKDNKYTEFYNNIKEYKMNYSWEAFTKKILEFSS